MTEVQRVMHYAPVCEEARVNQPEFERWSDAIAEAFFPPGQELPRPAYLDFDGAGAERLRGLLGLAQTHDIEAELVSTVRSVMGTPGRQMFQRQQRWLRIWARDVRELARASPEVEPPAPPILPLLAVFTVAAERMGSFTGVRDTAYYAPLATMLQCDAKQLAIGYRDVAEMFWGALNRWLELCGGQRGLPSAYAMGFRYVGLPLSQALVREADRARLGSFFQFAGFSPGQDVPPVAIDVLLKEWADSASSTVTFHLKTLISDSGSRERLAEIAAVELQAWRGSSGDSIGNGTNGSGKLLLRLEFSGTITRRVRLTPVLRIARSDPTMHVYLVGQADSRQPAELERVREGHYALPRSLTPDNGELLESTIKIEVEGTIFQRPASAVIVFRSDENGVEFVETPSVLRGEHLLILVREQHLDALRAVLEDVSAAGWLRSEEVGVPPGWALIKRVQVLRPPSEVHVGEAKPFAELLTPLTSHHLALLEGIRLPDAVRPRWLVGAVPTLSASSDDEGGFEVLVRPVADALARIESGSSSVEATQPLVSAFGSADVPVIVDLREAHLTAGTYEAVLRSRAAKPRDMARRMFDVVEPAARGIEDGVVALDPSDSRTTVDREANEAVYLVEDADGLVVGAAVFAELDAHEECVPAPVEPLWSKPARLETPSAFSFASGRPPECYIKKNHHWHIETVFFDAKGRPINKRPAGSCKFCGARKVYSSRPTRVRPDGQSEPSVTAATDLRDRPPLPAGPDRSDESGALPSRALIALAAVGAGSGALLQRTLQQVESDALARYAWVEELVSAAVISVSRDERSGEVVLFSMNPPTIVGADDHAVLTGYWPEPWLATVDEWVRTTGIGPARDSVQRFPLPAVLPVDAAELHAHLEELDLAVIHAPSASHSLSAIAQPLLDVVTALPRSKIERVGRLQWFDPKSASWVDSPSADRVGAVRSGTYSPNYYLRSEDDLVRGVGVRLDAATAKHASAALLGLPPLLYYDEGTASLRVPLGAPLPGLLGRALVLASGSQPDAEVGASGSKELIYRDVPRWLADRVTYLLTRREG